MRYFNNYRHTLFSCYRVKYYIMTLIFSILLAPACQRASPVAPSQAVSVSSNGHYLMNQDGTPFFWIGDTGWGIFQQLTREEVDIYLDNRKSKGFTIIQSVIFWFPHGGEEENGPLNAPNAYGHHPFQGEPNAPLTSIPLIKEGGDMQNPNDYWEHADYIIKSIKDRGLKLALLPCWGNAYVNNRMRGSQIEFTEEEARSYGQFLGERYRGEDHIIWCLGGDVDPVNFGDKDQRSVYRAMAEGIGRGVSGNKNLKWNEPHQDWDQCMMTFHAVRTPTLSGEGGEGGSSSIWFHNDPWLDMNMMETFQWMSQIHPYVSEDYQKTPPKPTILAEGAYELGKYNHECGFITPLLIRRQGYHAFFAGAAGYTYGHWALWPFRGTYCGVNWKEAMDYPGAIHMAQYMRQFIEEQEIFSFQPTQSLILSENPGGNYLQCAMIKNDSSKILVYLPEIKSIELNLSIIRGEGIIEAKWLDPRNGNRVKQHVKNHGPVLPPSNWEDAILLLERNSLLN